MKAGGSDGDFAVIPITSQKLPPRRFLRSCSCSAPAVLVLEDGLEHEEEHE